MCIYWENHKKLWYIYHGILLAHKKEHIWVSPKEVDEPRTYYSEWNKSERERQISYTNACIWNLERWYWWTCLQGSNGDTDIEDRLVYTVGEEESGMNWESSMETYAFSSVQFSHPVVSNSLWPHESQHATPPCPSPAPGVHPNPCPFSRWRHPTISSSVVPFSSCPQSFPASGSFQMSQLFTSQGQSIRASLSVLPMSIQG